MKVSAIHLYVKKHQIMPFVFYSVNLDNASIVKIEKASLKTFLDREKL